MSGSSTSSSSSSSSRRKTTSTTAAWHYDPYWAPNVDPDALQAQYEFVGLGECVNQVGTSLTLRKELYHMAKTTTYKDCIDAANDEPWATGFSFGRVDKKCRIYGWVYKKITVPPWTAFRMDSASTIEISDLQSSYDCWRKRLATTCGYPLGSKLDPQVPCEEGSRIAAGARCTVKCQSGYLPWPKITTCRKEGYLERPGCWPIDPKLNKLLIDVDDQSFLAQERAGVPLEWQLDTHGNPESWWYDYMDPDFTKDLSDMEVLFARMRLKYKVSAFDPATVVAAADAFDKEKMLESRRIGVYEPAVVRDSIMTQLKLPKQAVRITGIEWIRTDDFTATGSSAGRRLGVVGFDGSVERQGDDAAIDDGRRTSGETGRGDKAGAGEEGGTKRGNASGALDGATSTVKMEWKRKSAGPGHEISETNLVGPSESSASPTLKRRATPEDENVAQNASRDDRGHETSKKSRKTLEAAGAQEGAKVKVDGSSSASSQAVREAEARETPGDAPASSGEASSGTFPPRAGPLSGELHELHLLEVGKSSSASSGLVSLGRGYEKSASSTSTSSASSARRSAAYVDPPRFRGSRTTSDPSTAAVSPGHLSAHHESGPGQSQSQRAEEQATTPWQEFSYPQSGTTYYCHRQDADAQGEKKKHDVSKSPARKRRSPVYERLRRLLQRRGRRKEDAEEAFNRVRNGNGHSLEGEPSVLGRAYGAYNGHRIIVGNEKPQESEKLPPDPGLRAEAPEEDDDELFFSPEAEVNEAAAGGEEVGAEGNRRALRGGASKTNSGEGDSSTTASSRPSSSARSAQDQRPMEERNRESAEAEQVAVEKPKKVWPSNHDRHNPLDSAEKLSSRADAGGPQKKRRLDGEPPPESADAVTDERSSSTADHPDLGRALQNADENAVEYLEEDFYVEILPPSNLQEDSTKLREFQLQLERRMTVGLPLVTQTVLENVLARRRAVKSSTLSVEEFYGQNSAHIPMRIYYDLEGKSPGSRTNHPHHTDDHFTDVGLIQIEITNEPDDLAISFPQPFRKEVCVEKLSFNGYRGCQSYTTNAEQCQSWDRQWPTKHDFSPIYDTSDPFNSNPSLSKANLYATMLRNNFCANPDGRSPGSAQKIMYTSEAIWCNTASGWDYCEPKTRSPPIRCHPTEPFHLKIGGRRFEGFMHGSLPYLAPSQYETSVLMRTGVVPFQLERILNLTEHKDQYALWNPERSCEAWDSDFNGSFDIYCVDMVSDSVKLQIVKALSYEKSDDPEDVNKQIRSRLYINHKCTDRLFQPVHNFLPYLSGVRFSHSFRFDSDPVDIPTNITDNRHFGLPEQLTGQCREECMKRGFFECGAFVTKRYQDGLNFTEDTIGLHNCYLYHPDDLSENLVQIGAGPEGTNDVTTWKANANFKSARWNYTLAAPIPVRPPPKDETTFFESMMVVFLGLCFCLGAAIFYWAVKRYILKNIEWRKRAAEGKLNLKDGLGLNSAGAAGSSVPTLSVMAPVMRKGFGDGATPAPLPDHIIHIGGEDTAGKQDRKTAAREKRIGKRWRPRSGPGSGVPYGTSPELWHAGFQGRDSQYAPSSEADASPPAHGSQRSAKSSYARKVSPTKRTAWLDEKAPDLMIGAGRGIDDPKQFRLMKENRIKSTNKLLEACMDDDNFPESQIVAHDDDETMGNIIVQDVGGGSFSPNPGANRVRGSSVPERSLGMIAEHRVAQPSSGASLRGAASGVLTAHEARAMMQNPVEAAVRAVGGVHRNAATPGGLMYNSNVGATAGGPAGVASSGRPGGAGLSTRNNGGGPAMGGNFYTLPTDELGGEALNPHYGGQQQSGFSAHMRGTGQQPSSVLPSLSAATAGGIAPAGRRGSAPAGGSSTGGRYLAEPSNYDIGEGSMKNAARDSAYMRQRDLMFGGGGYE